MRSEDGAVGNILPDEFESGQRLQLAQAMFFHAHVVSVVQVVHAGDGMSLQNPNTFSSIWLKRIA